MLLLDGMGGQGFESTTRLRKEAALPKLNYTPTKKRGGARKNTPKARRRAPFGIRPSPESDVIVIDGETLALAKTSGKKFRA